MPTINERWEMGIDHDPRSVKIARGIAEIDEKQCSIFYFKFGGDGDNGETLLYLLDVYFEQEDEKTGGDELPVSHTSGGTMPGPHEIPKEQLERILLQQKKFDLEQARRGRDRPLMNAREIAHHAMFLAGSCNANLVTGHTVLCEELRGTIDIALEQRAEWMRDMAAIRSGDARAMGLPVPEAIRDLPLVP